MPVGPDSPAAAVAEAGLHFRDPLAVCGAAQPEAVGEQPGPVFPVARIAPFAEPLAPKVFRPFFTVPVMRVAPQPSGEGLILVGVTGAARHPLVLFRLSDE